MIQPTAATLPASTKRASTKGVAAIATALVLLTVFAGYPMGKQMAQRDNARAADAAGS